MHKLAKALIFPLAVLNVVLLFFIFSLNIDSIRTCFLDYDQSLTELPIFLRILFGAMIFYLSSFFLIIYSLLTKQKTRGALIILINLALIFASTQFLFHYLLPEVCLVR